MLKKINKMIIIIMICFISVVSIVPTKKTNAFVLESYLVYQAGVSFMAFAGFAQLMIVNGYHMEISHAVGYFIDSYYTKVNDNYILKDAESINHIDKFKYYVMSKLTGEELIDNTLKEELRNEMIAKFGNPELKSMIPDLTIQNIYGHFLDSKSLDETNTSTLYFVSEEYKNKKIRINSSNGLDYVDILTFDFGTYHDSLNKRYYPILKFILNNDLVKTQHIEKGKSYPTNDMKTVYMNGKNLTFDTWGSSQSIYFNNDETLIKENTDYIPNSFATDISKEFILPNLTYLSALSNKAKTYDDLKNLINTDEYLQKEIMRLLENQKVNIENEISNPFVSDEGYITYPDSKVPDLPIEDNTPYNPPKAWYNDIFGTLANVPDLIIGGTTDLINNTIVPGLATIKDTVLDIPNNIARVFVPTKVDLISTIQPVRDLYDLKLSPIIAPFINLGFYELPIKDVYVDLKFINMPRKSYKIIDYSHLNSIRESIKSIIRAFFWILLIFYNIDQVHRVIRGTSIFNTYVHRVEADYKKNGGN